MTASHDGGGVKTNGAAAEVREARAEVLELQQEVVAAHDREASTNEALREANAQLVVSSLQAHSDVEVCTKALKEASRTSEHDELTGLPNRTLLRDRFERALVHAKRDSTSLAVLFLDLDNFKDINDRLGHAVGDLVLKGAAHCLVATIREGDTVSRHGGDEFVVLLDGVCRGTDAAIVAQKVGAALGRPLPFCDEVPRLTASIGISVYPRDGSDVDTLIERADAAMYVAKKQGPGGFAFHGEEARSDPGESFVAVRRRK